MSPLSLRRYRAERLLREEFDGLRGRVIAIARGRLRARGVRLDASDLDACYAQAWQGLYMAVLDGQEIANPTGWLALVTFRRAIEEARAPEHVHCASVRGQGIDGGGSASDRRTRAGSRVRTAEEPDLAAELDDRVRLRQLFEALRGRLSARELQAAALCYLQGLSRSEAAVRMGVSEAGMRKLMEGHGAGRPGVAGKVGALIETIRAGGWCDEQGSLMRGFAYGILDPDGERYRLALIHHNECPSCRAYVLSLRGLAAALPPVPWLVHWALGAGADAATGAARAGAHAGAAAARLGGTSAPAGTGSVAPAGSEVGAALSASGAAGAGAAGGGWLLAGGPVGAKLAVGCLLALGVGAGCVALTGELHRARTPVHRRESARVARPGASAAGQGTYGGLLTAGGVGAPDAQRVGSSARGRTASSPALTSARRAGREFGLEQGLATGGARSVGAAGRSAPTARSAATATGRVPATESEGVTVAGSSAGSASVRASAPADGRSAGAYAAQREFAPG